MKGCMAIVLAMYQDELYILSLAWAVYILPNECLYTIPLPAGGRLVVIRRELTGRHQCTTMTNVHSHHSVLVHFL